MKRGGGNSRTCAALTVEKIGCVGPPSATFLRPTRFSAPQRMGGSSTGAASASSSSSDMLTVKRLCEQVGLPQRLDSISASSQDNLTRYAGLLGASSAQLDVLANIPIDSQRTMVRAALQRLRSRGVRKLRRGDVISLENWTELRAWEDVNPVSDRRARDGSADGSRGGAPSVSGSASSLQDAETLELRRTVKELSDKVKLLEAERGGDDNDDNANDSRKLVLSEQLWEDLPEDSVRAEISKSSMRDTLRRYTPCPQITPLRQANPRRPTRPVCQPRRRSRSMRWRASSLALPTPFALSCISSQPWTTPNPRGAMSVQWHWTQFR